MTDMIWAQLSSGKFRFALELTLLPVHASQHMKTITYHMVELYFITIVELSFNSHHLLQDNPTTLHQDSKYCKLDLHTALWLLHLSVYKLFTVCLYRYYGSSVIQTIYTLWADTDVFQPQQFLSRNNLTEISGVPLRVVKYESTWGKALGAGLVFSILQLNIVFTDSLFHYFELIVISIQPQLQYIAQYLQYGKGHFLPEKPSTFYLLSTFYFLSFCLSTTPSTEWVVPIYFSGKISITLAETDNVLGGSKS